MLLCIVVLQQNASTPRGKAIVSIVTVLEKNGTVISSDCYHLPDGSRYRF
jgi:hypothetical protein